MIFRAIAWLFKDQIVFLDSVNSVQVWAIVLVDAENLLLKLQNGIFFDKLSLRIALSENPVKFHSISDALLGDVLFDLVHELLNLPLNPRFALAEIYQRRSYSRPIPWILALVALSLPLGGGSIATFSLWL